MGFGQFNTRTDLLSVSSRREAPTAVLFQSRTEITDV